MFTLSLHLCHFWFSPWDILGELRGLGWNQSICLFFSPTANFLIQSNIYYGISFFQVTSEPGVKAGERICRALRHFHEHAVGVEGGKTASHWCPQFSSWIVWVWHITRQRDYCTDRTEVSLNYLDGPATSQGRRTRKSWCLSERRKTKSTGALSPLPRVCAVGVRHGCELLYACQNVYIHKIQYHTRK